MTHGEKLLLGLKTQEKHPLAKGQQCWGNREQPPQCWESAPLLGMHAVATRDPLVESTRRKLPSYEQVGSI